MSAPFKGKTVLIVDDEPGFHEIIGDEFKIMGATILTAESVDAAEKVLAKQPVDLIVSDTNMPGRSGLNLLERVRQKSGARLPFILMTGFAEVSSDRTYAKEADAVFIKPFHMDDLLLKAEFLIGQKSAL
jgi:DNA-binding response OmpR family regulator